MKFFSLFTSSKLSPIWQFSADHTIWRIMFSRFGMIIGEDRNTETKTVTFFCIDAETGLPLWKNRTFDEQWWIGLSGVTEERLYLHGFRKPDMPEQKNIIAVDVKNGTQLWKNTECTFIAIQSPYIYGYKDLFERRVYYKIDEQSGTTIEELQSLPPDISPNGQYEKTDFSFPQPVTAADEELWKLISLGNGFKSAEQTVTEQFYILNVYSQHPIPEQGLKNTLSIIDRTTKKKVYSDVLNGSTPYPVPDSFFMDGEKVYYIKERKTFVALELKS